MGIKSKFSTEFKLEAVKLVTEQGYTQAEAASSLGINAKSLNRWVKEVASNRLTDKGRPILTTEQEELYRLRKENKRLRLEREILKKAAVGSNSQCNTVLLLTEKDKELMHEPTKLFWFFRRATEGF